MLAKDFLDCRSPDREDLPLLESSLVGGRIVLISNEAVTSICDTCTAPGLKKCWRYADCGRAVVATIPVPSSRQFYEHCTDKIIRLNPLRSKTSFYCVGLIITAIISCYKRS